MFLPLKSEAKTKYFPAACILLIALNIYIFFKELSLGAEWLRPYSAVPYEIWHNIDKPPSIHFHVYFTLITSLFFHGSLVHLISNMFYLWIFGAGIEDKIGHIRFIFFYLICGVAASFAHIVFNQESMLPIIGASGAVSGVLGSYLIIFPKAKIKTLVLFRVLRIPSFVFLSMWIILQILNLFKTQSDTNIAWWAHIGGFAAGFIFIRLYQIKKG